MSVHRFLRTLVHDYGWVHLGIGMIGNVLFLTGSILFLPDWSSVQLAVTSNVVAWKTVGTWLFITGSVLMLVGRIGELLVSLYSRRKSRREARKQQSAA